MAPRSSGLGTAWYGGGGTGICVGMMVCVKLHEGKGEAAGTMDEIGVLLTCGDGV